MFLSAEYGIQGAHGQSDSTETTSATSGIEQETLLILFATLGLVLGIPAIVLLVCGIKALISPMIAKRKPIAPKKKRIKHAPDDVEPVQLNLYEYRYR